MSFPSKEAWAAEKKRVKQAERRRMLRQDELGLTLHEEDPVAPPQGALWSRRNFNPIEPFPHILEKDGNRPPFPNELEYAKYSIRNFHLFGQGSRIVVTNDSSNGEIVAAISFTPIQHLSIQEKNDINTVTTFLQGCKQFVHPVQSVSRVWGGEMRCVGWRKSYEQFQLFGRYTWAERIQANLFEYNRLMNSSRGPSNILGTMFRNMANVAFQDNQDLL